ncbi:MAG: protein-(glutamine-N5) methyltransferase, release factor-specific [Gammaproteobacteria bacterium RIFCSPHIGHO2_12_FULL_38_14]|nr:MAG: protein-(glutamine-N5) methyltransferase, release factor-specific [Gammaproteobacteria bacterium RIFCSPHIGHO2_12_FULL_38_14]
MIAVTDCPRLEAEVLLAHVLQKPRSYLYTHSLQEVLPDTIDAFDACVKRRLAHEPIAYIIGEKEFWSLPFMVTRDTLIPRQETETIVEAVLKLFPPNQSFSLADLGTGCGAIALAVLRERPHCSVTATDLSPQALKIAAQNAKRFGLHCSFLQGSWCNALPQTKFDVIVSNPPYIAASEWNIYEKGLSFEPYAALVSGHDGLEAITEICKTASNYLRPGGYLLIEHGYSQGPSLEKIFTAAGYHDMYVVCDFSENERVTGGHW